MSFQGNSVCAYLGDIAGQTLTAYIDRQRSPVWSIGPYRISCYSYLDDCNSPSREVRVEVSTSAPAFTCSLTETRMQCRSSVSSQVYDLNSGQSLGTMTGTGTLDLVRAN